MDKKPGVMPIGIREVVRRIIGKAVLCILKQEIQSAAGTDQLCSEQPGGVEAAIHALKNIFDDPSTEAVLLVDANNAFNSLNGEAALHNVAQLCPALSTILKNTDGFSLNLFVGGTILKSTEGTTQGDPMATAMYAIGILPLIRHLREAQSEQVWFADDSSPADKLMRVKKWWDILTTIGPSYGYFPNAIRILVKEGHISEAQSLFNGSNVNVTTEGRRLLGAAIGSKSFVTDFISKRVSNFSK